MELVEKAALEKSEKIFKPYTPRQVLFTPDALEERYGQEIYERVQQQNMPFQILKNNRLTGLRGETERETYKLAKSTLAIVKKPPLQFGVKS